MLRCRIWRNVVSADRTSDWWAMVSLYRRIVPKYMSSSCAKRALQNATGEEIWDAMGCDAIRQEEASTSASAFLQTPRPSPEIIILEGNRGSMMQMLLYYLPRLAQIN